MNGFKEFRNYYDGRAKSPFIQRDKRRGAFLIRFEIVLYQLSSWSTLLLGGRPRNVKTEPPTRTERRYIDVSCTGSTSS